MFEAIKTKIKLRDKGYYIKASCRTPMCYEIYDSFGKRYKNYIWQNPKDRFWYCSKKPKNNPNLSFKYPELAALYEVPKIIK